LVLGRCRACEADLLREEINGRTGYWSTHTDPWLDT